MEKEEEKGQLLAKEISLANAVPAFLVLRTVEQAVHFFFLCQLFSVLWNSGFPASSSISKKFDRNGGLSLPLFSSFFYYNKGSNSHSANEQRSILLLGVRVWAF